MTHLQCAALPLASLVQFFKFRGSGSSFITNAWHGLPFDSKISLHELAMSDLDQVSVFKIICFEFDKNIKISQVTFGNFNQYFKQLMLDIWVLNVY